MRRVLALAGVCALAALAVLALSSYGPAKPHFTVELDNAFGIIPGGDVKIAGVRAGVVTGVRLERPSYRALAAIRVDATGYGSFRHDAHCAVRLQSLLGEYFLDCDPGSPDQRGLRYGARIPVTQTESTVAPDLVLGIMRLPYRERLRIVVSELGAGVAGNAQNLNAALVRAVPALRQTDAVLAKLAAQRHALRRLVSSAHSVVGALAERRNDVARWVVSARNTAVVTARRHTELASALDQLPGFLDQLTPAMRDLRTIAQHGAPVAANLDASAGELHGLLGNVTTLSSAARPAITQLGHAADQGTRALSMARPQAEQLRALAAGLPELSQNLAIILETLNDPRKAVEQNPLSPGGRGFTALQNFLNYIYNQVLAINVYDGENHILKGGIFVNDCSPYQDAEKARQDPKTASRCASRLGPNQPGVTTPDPSAPAPGAANRHPRLPAAPSRPKATSPFGPLATQPFSSPAAPAAPALAAPTLAAATATAQQTTKQLLDYLLRP